MLKFFQRFSNLNFISQIARTLGRSVHKLLNGSMVNLYGQFIFGKETSSFFRGNTAFQGSRFLDMVKTGLFFTFFPLIANC